MLNEMMLLNTSDNVKIRRPLWIRFCLLFKPRRIAIIDCGWGFLRVEYKFLFREPYIDAVDILSINSELPMTPEKGTTH